MNGPTSSDHSPSQTHDPRPAAPDAITVFARIWFFVIAALAAAGSTTHAQAPGQAFIFNGIWTSNQFQCPAGRFHTERVSISQSGQFIAAVKIDGDSCVGAGQSSFKGNVTWNSGNLQCLQNNIQNGPTYPGVLKVIDPNTIEACNMTFRRDTTTASAPNPYPTSSAPTNPYPTSSAPTNPYPANPYPAGTTTSTQPAPGPTAAPPVYNPALDYTRNLAGTRWTYSFGNDVHQFTFGQQTIDNVSPGNWQRVSWAPIGNNRIRLWDAQNQREMILTFTSPTSYTGVGWDKITPVAGTRLGAAAANTGTSTTQQNTAVVQAQAQAARTAELQAVYAQAKSQIQAAGVTVVDERKNDTLNSNAFKDVSLGQLRTGYEYGVAVVCDNLCTNVDLAVTDGKGAQAGKDNTIARAAQVTFTPKQNQLYSARVSMASCTSNPCQWSLLVVSAPIQATTGTQTQSTAPVQTTYQRPAAAPSPRAAEVLTLLGQGKVLMNQAGANVIWDNSNGSDTLNSGESVVVPLPQLTPGQTYGFMGVCDTGCDDMNLWLADNNGWVVSAIDTEPDSEPEILWTAMAGQQYQITIHMISCSSDPCHWGIVGGQVR